MHVKPSELSDKKLKICLLQMICEYNSLYCHHKSELYFKIKVGNKQIKRLKFNDPDWNIPMISSQNSIDMDRKKSNHSSVTFTSDALQNTNNNNDLPNNNNLSNNMDIDLENNNNSNTESNHENMDINKSDDDDMDMNNNDIQINHRNILKKTKLQYYIYILYCITVLYIYIYIAMSVGKKWKKRRKNIVDCNKSSQSSITFG